MTEQAFRYPVTFFLSEPATAWINTLSLHDALPICSAGCSLLTWVAAHRRCSRAGGRLSGKTACAMSRSEEHTSELQSRRDLVCRLLLEKKKRCRRSSACAKQSADVAPGRSTAVAKA